MGLTAFAIPNHAAVGRARREITLIAHELGFDATQISELEIASTELATNLVKNHAIKAEILIRTLRDGESVGIEMASVDFGPGIADVNVALSDHFSTHGTSGTGLGAVSRLTSEFDIFSHTETAALGKARHRPDPAGTIVTCRKWVTVPADRRFEYCALARAHPGEAVNGDGYIFKQTEDRMLIGVADGAGHGLKAQEASQRALEHVNAHAEDSFPDLLAHIHDQLRDTRGAALTLLRLDRGNRTMEHAGVGNVDVRTYPREQSGLLTRPGTLGFGQFSQPRVTTTQWPVDMTVVVHTDGISGRWSFDKYPDLLNRKVSTIAHYMMRSFRRRSDDATLVVVRDGSGPWGASQSD